MEKPSRSLKIPNLHLPQPRSIPESLDRAFPTPKIPATLNNPLPLRKQTMCSHRQEPESMAGGQPQITTPTSFSRRSFQNSSEGTIYHWVKRHRASPKTIGRRHSLPRRRQRKLQRHMPPSNLHTRQACDNGHQSDQSHQLSSPRQRTP